MTRRLSSTLILFAASVLTLNAIASDENANAVAKPFERYLVTLSEYQLEGAASPKLSDSDIFAMITTQKLTPIETIRVSTISGFEGMAQFGKQVTVTTGKTTNRESTMRQTRQVPIGTVLRVTAKSEGSEVMMNIQFESSRLDGEGTDDSPPDIVTNRISTSQLFSLEKPTMVGGTSADKSFYAIVTVLKLPQSKP